VERELTGSRFDVLLNDVPVREVHVPGRLMLLNDAASSLAAKAQKHGPVLGFDESLWLPATTVVPESEKSKVLDLDEVLARQVMELLKQHAHLFMGVQEVQWVIDKVQVDYPGLVAEVQKILPLQRIAEVLRRLLEEQVPIRNVRTIFESLIAWGPKEKDMLMLTEHVRGDLGRYLAFEAGAGRPYVSAILLEPGVEQAVRSCIKPTPAGNFLAMPPEQTSVITSKVAEIAAGHGERAGLAMITSMDIRRYVRKMIEPRLDWLRVYSYQELGSLVELRPVGRVG
jgi:type III secretion protein V